MCAAAVDWLALEVKLSKQWYVAPYYFPASVFLALHCIGGLLCPWFWTFIYRNGTL